MIAGLHDTIETISVSNRQSATVAQGERDDDEPMREAGRTRSWKDNLSLVPTNDIDKLRQLDAALSDDKRLQVYFTRTWSERITIQYEIHQRQRQSWRELMARAEHADLVPSQTRAEMVELCLNEIVGQRLRAQFALSTQSKAAKYCFADLYLCQFVIELVVRLCPKFDVAVSLNFKEKYVMHVRFAQTSYRITQNS
jgi:hypothetical protein